MKNIEKLKDLKEELERTKSERSELMGRYKALLETVKKEFGITGKADAEKKIQELEADIESTEAGIQEDINVLLVKYNIEIDDEESAE